MQATRTLTITEQPAILRLVTENNQPESELVTCSTPVQFNEGEAEEREASNLIRTAGNYEKLLHQQTTRHAGQLQDLENTRAYHANKLEEAQAKSEKNKQELEQLESALQVIEEEYTITLEVSEEQRAKLADLEGEIKDIEKHLKENSLKYLVEERSKESELVYYMQLDRLVKILNQGISLQGMRWPAVAWLIAGTGLCAQTFFESQGKTREEVAKLVLLQRPTLTEYEALVLAEDVIARQEVLRGIF